MELRQLRYFVGVTEAGSLLKASSKLHVAQPALGQQITDLEHEIGAQLFARSNRGMALTPAGKTFLEHAKVILADVERARVAVKDSGHHPIGEVVIGLPTTVALAATIPILQACQKRMPQVRLRLVEAYSGFLREWLLSGRLDIALLFGDAPETGILKRPLLDEKLAFVTRVDGTRLHRTVKLQTAVKQPLVLPGQGHGLRRIIDDACELGGLTLNVVAEIESLTSVKRAVEAGIGNTILSSSSVSEEVAQGRLRAAIIDSPGMSRRVVCGTNLTRPMTAASSAAMALVFEVIQELVKSNAWIAQWLDFEDDALSSLRS